MYIMHARFRFKLSMTMIVFAVIVSFSIAIADYFRLKEQVMENNRFQVEQIEGFLIYSLETIEKAYDLFGNELKLSMESSSRYLSRMYEDNPRFDEWDFQALKDQLGFDIYIINENNVITHSSNPNDIGLDFSVCCRKLATVLDERRKAGGFYHDGLDVEQYSGHVKKYSYMATPDNKYLIQLGISLENEPIYQEFQLLKTIGEWKEAYASINEINVLNIGGLALGKPAEEGKVANERRPMFEQALRTKQTTEVQGEWNNRPAVFRYVPHVSRYDDGTTKIKVLEIVYNQMELNALLRKHQVQFCVQLLIILAVTIFVSHLISRWVARPMYLAFHDSLTGLKNRAAFEDTIASVLRANKGTTALLMLDLDNFKPVNDQLGHDAGDRLLKSVAQTIRSAVGKRDHVFRMGGDEFIVVMPETGEQEAAATAERIIESVRQRVAGQHREHTGGNLSVSVGISLAPEHSLDPEILCKKADQALYMSKEKGKNRWQLYPGDGSGS